MHVKEDKLMKISQNSKLVFTKVMYSQPTVFLSWLLLFSLMITSCHKPPDDFSSYSYSSLTPLCSKIRVPPFGYGFQTNPWVKCIAIYAIVYNYFDLHRFLQFLTIIMFIIDLEKVNITFTFKKANIISEKIYRYMNRYISRHVNCALNYSSQKC